MHAVHPSDAKAALTGNDACNSQALKPTHEATPFESLLSHLPKDQPNRGDSSLRNTWSLHGPK